MILASRLNGFRPVELFQNHDPRQMVGEGHRPHREPEIRLFLDPGCHAEGGADEKTGAALSGELHGGKLFGKGFAAEFLALRCKDAEPGPLGDSAEDFLRFLFKTRLNIGRTGIFRQTVFGQFQKGKPAVAGKPLTEFRNGFPVKFFFYFWS